MAKTQNYRLLSTAIVNAVGRGGNQSKRGAIWTATEQAEHDEGEALVRVGIAEHTNEKATVQTFNEQQRAAREKVVEANPDMSDDDADLAAILDGNVDDVVAALDSLDDAQVQRIGELEAEGKDRTGVANAVAARLEGE